MRILCAIANYGSKNNHFCRQLIDTYTKMPVEVKCVILSEQPKDYGSDVDIKVGLPSTNPWSLPFAHRPLFQENLDAYDFFIYSEDDTLLSWQALEAFIQSVDALHEDEIAGFVRTEQGPDEQLYYSTCHSYFRWIPSSICERSGKLWAKYSNEHAACFIASQSQLRRAIESGGFPVEPHEGRHDMLCAAATDIYTQCGYRRLVCVDDVEKFTLKHLPNKYIGKMGLPANELTWQIEALRQINSGTLSNYELLNPETRLPGGIGSKFYREQPDPALEAILGHDHKRVLVWGAGDGIFESGLQKQGHEVSVIPLDAVVGESCRQRGLTVLSPDLGDVKDKPFDIVILRDVIHLVKTPKQLLADLKGLLRSDGYVLIRLPNFYDARLLKRRYSHQDFKGDWTPERLGVEIISHKSLKKVLREAGFSRIKVRGDVPEKRQRVNTLTLGLFNILLSPNLYISAR